MKNQLNEATTKDFLSVLKKRIEQLTHFPKGYSWEVLAERFKKNPSKLWSLYQIEQSGGEPGLLSWNDKIATFCDSSTETPKERRSFCYDPEALLSRKLHKPEHSAVGLADEFGIRLMTEDEYLQLQQLKPVDLKTSSWLHTPDEVRKLGGAIFGDRRFNRTFIYHNGAESYYAARGFRAILEV